MTQSLLLTDSSPPAAISMENTAVSPAATELPASSIINMEPIAASGNESQQDRLFGLIRMNAAIAAARGPPPSYEEANNPNSITHIF